MSSNTGEDPPLQFDTATPVEAAGAEAAAGAVSCALCSGTIDREYFDVNGQSVCERCHAQLAEHAETPRGFAPVARALAFGTGAAVLGAILYYAVIAITRLEIGIVAIAIGYMVGYAIRLATRGRGGRRFQIMALVLTYWAVGLAYVPLAFRELSNERQQRAAQQSQVAPSEPGAASEGGGPGLLFTLAVLVVLSLALPVMIILGSMPGGLISGAIIAFGMHQAWRMTGAPPLVISGPYRIGTAPPALP